MGELGRIEVVEFLEKSELVRRDVQLADINWFRVGGKAKYYYKARNIADLELLLKNIPEDYPLFVLGVGSNVIIKDGGFDGLVLRLGRDFASIESNNTVLKVGAAALDLSVANFACNNEIAGLEFLSGIPGTIGGALRMNAGSYGAEMQDVLVSAVVYDRAGKSHNITTKDMNFSYRKSKPIIENGIFVEAILQGTKGDRIEIANKINEIQVARSDSQPIKSRTGGSTFKNPAGLKAWELIDRAGMRGYSIGDAMISEKHCNFMINKGNATASDLINLGELVRTKVQEVTGVLLEWEIQIIGNDV